MTVEDVGGKKVEEEPTPEPTSAHEKVAAEEVVTVKAPASKRSAAKSAPQPLAKRRMGS